MNSIRIFPHNTCVLSRKSGPRAALEGFSPPFHLVAGTLTGISYLLIHALGHTNPHALTSAYNGTSFILSAAVPALQAVSTSERINILRNTPSILCTRFARCSTVSIRSRSPKHTASPIIHIHLPYRDAVVDCSGRKGPLLSRLRDASSFDIADEERLFQDIVDEVLAQGVWITRTWRLRVQALVELRPSIRLAVTAALSRKVCERAAEVIKAACTKALTNRK